MKKCYCYDSGTHMLNNRNIRDTIERYQWFDRTVNVQSNHQQQKDKENEKKVHSGVDVSVSITKTSGWKVLQTSLHSSKQMKNTGHILEK